MDTNGLQEGFYVKILADLTYRYPWRGYRGSASPFCNVSLPCEDLDDATAPLIQGQFSNWMSTKQTLQKKCKISARNSCEASGVMKTTIQEMALNLAWDSYLNSQVT
jgi:hypothetical protein